MSKDKVKYYPNQGDKYVAYRCECGYKSMIAGDDSVVCQSCGKAEGKAPVETNDEAPIHLGDLKGDK